jgi:hypothetical protein
MAANPFAEFAAPQENPFTQFAVAPQPTEVPGQRRSGSALTQFGRSAASLADVTLGSIIPGAAQYLAHPMLRAAGRSPEQATASTQALVGAVDKPFGKAFGVTETPEYQKESSRQVMDFIGQNLNKGAKWISEKTGIPEADAENMIGSLTLAAPKVVPPVVGAVKKVVAPIVEKAKIGAQMPFEPMLQKGRERRSAESYAKAPQLDALAEAQRLKLAMNPADIESSVSSRFYSAAAGPRGPEALAEVNRPRVAEIAKNELGIDSTTSLTGDSYKQARADLAKPYDDVRKLPTMVADETAIKNLNDLRKNDKLIGGEGVAKKVNKLIDEAVTKTQAGFTGAELLDNVRNLRTEAKKTYNNQNATLKQLAVADANLTIANQLESMIDSNISNPKLLGQFRDARQKMARTYSYEGATDFNTGMVDVSKLARITAKDNALTGDIASLGKIAGNFPDVFTTQAASKFYDLPRLSRSGLAGGGGALIGSNFGLTGSIVGGLAGGGLGEIGGALAAKRMTSPGYQAGLKLQDFRIPTNQLAASMQPIPQNQAIVPFDPRNALVQPTDIVGYSQDGTPITATQAFSRPNFVFGRPEAQVNVSTPYAPNQLPAPSATSTLSALRAEDVRAAEMSRTLGKQTEAQTAAAEAAARTPTGRGSVLEFDPITGTYKVGGEGVKGATPEVFMSDSGASLKSAAEKMALNQPFAMSAAEKVAWEKTKVDLATVAPELKGLSTKELSSKMQDRQWVSDTIAKIQEKAKAFDEISKRASDAQAVRNATMQREKMMDLLSDLEDALRPARPSKTGGQGPKTREFRRNALAPESENKNALPPRLEASGMTTDNPTGRFTQ